jgi:hypothetical protein
MSPTVAIILRPLKQRIPPMGGTLELLHYEQNQLAFDDRSSVHRVLE